MNGRTAAIIGGLALIGVGALLIGSFGGKEKPPARAGATTDQRVREGPYIASTKALSDTEDLRIVVVPHPLGEFFDTVCLIYTHRDFHIATFTCPDADRTNLKDSVADNELQRPLR